MKIRKLKANTYQVEKDTKQVLIIDKSVLKKTISQLEKQKANLTTDIAERKKLLTEINKVT